MRPRYTIEWDFIFAGLTLLVIALMLLSFLLASCATGPSPAFRKALAGADISVRGLADAASVAYREQCREPLEHCVSSGSDPVQCTPFEKCAGLRDQWYEPARKLLESAARMVQTAAQLADAGDEKNANARIAAAMKIISELRPILVDLQVIP